jgi:hypothetical protein
MGIFSKKKEFVDLGERYRKQQERADNLRSNMDEPAVAESVQTEEKSASPFPFFAGFGGTPKAETPISNADHMSVESSNERKTRLAKRLSDMTSKMEDMENQLYHLQQRLELLERKSGVNGF